MKDNDATYYDTPENRWCERFGIIFSIVLALLLVSGIIISLLLAPDPSDEKVCQNCKNGLVEDNEK